MISTGTNLKNVRVKTLTMSKAALAREVGIDVKTYGTIEEGSKPGRDVTRELIMKTVNRLLSQKQLKTLSEEELFPRK